MVAFYLPGGTPVYAFSLLLSLGASAGLVWLVERTILQAPVQVSLQTLRSRGLRLLNAGLVALGGALIGGRAAFVALNWSFYRAHLLESLQIFQGGLSGVGALAGSILLLALYAGYTGQRLGMLADSLLPLAGCLAVSAWLGCWLEGCFYGPPSSAWWAIPSLDEWGVLSPRFPTQLVGGLLTLILVWLLDHYHPVLRESGYPPGWTAALGLAGLSIELFALSFLRADPAPAWLGLRLEAWAALAFLALAGSWLWAHPARQETV